MLDGGEDEHQLIPLVGGEGFGRAQPASVHTLVAVGLRLGARGGLGGEEPGVETDFTSAGVIQREKGTNSASPGRSTPASSLSSRRAVAA